MASTDRPIGVFDSGLGGLTVVRAIRDSLPNEAIVYLGDTARVPYGTRSRQTVIRYAQSCAARLMQHDIKYLVVACNTVSAVALEQLREESTVPVLGVIVPGAQAGVAATKNGRIGVLATRGTVASNAYPIAIQQMLTSARVTAVEAPLLVPLAEEGWVEGEVPERVVDTYLQTLADDGVDTLVLGCTHYPLLQAVIEQQVQRRLGEHVKVVDSAHATAISLVHELEAAGLAAHSVLSPSQPSLTVLVTDAPAHFQQTAARFLGEKIAETDMFPIDL